jgi:IclR family transcriptional regulator, acetate operon repressor
MIADQDPKSTGRVQSITRAFELLDVIAARNGAVPLSVLAEQTGLSQPTAHRLLRTLAGLGHVQQNDARSYGLGPGLVRLGEAASYGLAVTGRPVLEDLVRSLGESANLAMLQGDQVLYVSHIPCSQSVRSFTEVGSRVPIHSTGVGKAMLARLPEDRARSLLARTGLNQRTANTRTDVDALMCELGRIADLGYALDDEEQEAGVRCVAVMVPVAAPLLAVSISGPASRLTRRAAQRAVPLLERAARAIAGHVDCR